MERDSQGGANIGRARRDVDQEDSHWSKYALCAQVDPEIFFPEQGGSPSLAKAICLRCVELFSCRKDALSETEDFDTAGVRGGLTARERMRIRNGKK